MNNLIRGVIFALAVLCGISADARLLHGTSGVHGWNTFEIGAGGQVTNIDWPNASAPLLITTDTGGAYAYAPGPFPSRPWVQLVTKASMPSALTDMTASPERWMNGAYDLASAPSSAAICYMGYSTNNGDENTAHVLKSTNCNASDPNTITWTDLAGFTTACTSNCIWTSNSGPYKATGRKIGIDPNNANVLIVTTPHSGQFLSTDGGTTFGALNNVTASAGNLPAVGVAFDNSSAHNCGSGSNQTCTVWICSQGSGCWRSTTGSTGTFSQQTSGTGPTNVGRAHIGIDGVFYACEYDQTKLWRFTTTWTDITPAGGTGACASPVVSPFTAANVAMVGPSGSIFWSMSANSGTPSWVGATTAAIRSAADIPWFIVPASPATQDYLSIFEMVMDPNTAGKLWGASGIGVWNTTSTSGQASYTGVSRGIEQLVVNQIISGAGCSPVVAAWDRATWYMNSPTSYKSGYGPDYIGSIEFGWSIASSPTTPSFVAQLNISGQGGGYNSSYSTDCGNTWTHFAFFPTATVDLNTYTGGYIAVSDGGASTAKIAFAIGNEGGLYTTTNNGTSAWTEVDLPTVFGNGMQNPGPGVTVGFQHNGRVNRQSMCADSAGGGIFYIYNSNASATGGGFYKTSNTFTSAARMIIPFTGAANNGGLANQMNCVPGKTGYVFYAGGQQGASLFLTKDGGTNWPATTTPAAITGTFVDPIHSTSGSCTPTDVYQVATGAIKSGNDFPSVFIVGTCGGNLGVWEADNTNAQWNAGTAIAWKNLGLPSGWFDQPSALSGDNNTYGVAYLGGKAITTFIYTP